MRGRLCGGVRPTAEVTATGVRTKFGRTAELVRTAHVVSSQQKGRAADRAQPCHLQCWCHPFDGSVCLHSFHVVE